MSKPQIGFIGVGLMGHGMAKNIVEKGYPLTVTAHRNRAPVDDLIGRGATEAARRRHPGGSIQGIISGSEAADRSLPGAV